MNSSGPLSCFDSFNSAMIGLLSQRKTTPQSWNCMTRLIPWYHFCYNNSYVCYVAELKRFPIFDLLYFFLLDYFLHHPVIISAAFSTRPFNAEKSSVMKPPPRTLTYSRTWSDTPWQLTRRSAGRVELLDQLLWHVRTRSLSLHYRSGTDPPSPFSPITSIKVPCHSLFPVGIQWYSKLTL